MNIHSLNDINNNNNNNNNTNNTHSHISNIFTTCFPKHIFHTKTISFILICIFITIPILSYFIYLLSSYPSYLCFLYLYGGTSSSIVIHNYYYHTLITSLFLQYDFIQLLINLLFFVFISFISEYTIQSKLHFGLILFISGITANVISITFDPYNVHVGCDGAFYGLCGLLVLTFVLNYNFMSYNYRISYFVFIGFIAFNVLLCLLGSNRLSTVLGGLMFGVLGSYVCVFGRNGKEKLKLRYEWYNSGSSSSGANNNNNDNIFVQKDKEYKYKIMWYICVLILVFVPVCCIVYIEKKTYPNMIDLVCHKVNVTHIQ